MKNLSKDVIALFTKRNAAAFLYRGFIDHNDLEPQERVYLREAVKQKKIVLKRLLGKKRYIIPSLFHDRRVSIKVWYSIPLEMHEQMCRVLLHKMLKGLNYKESERTTYFVERGIKNAHSGSDFSYLCYWIIYTVQTVISTDKASYIPVFVRSEGKLRNLWNEYNTEEDCYYLTCFINLWDVVPEEEHIPGLSCHLLYEYFFVNRSDIELKFIPQDYRYTVLSDFIYEQKGDDLFGSASCRKIREYFDYVYNEDRNRKIQ